MLLSKARIIIEFNINISRAFQRNFLNKPYWRVVSWQGWLGGYLEFFFCIPLFCRWGSTPIFAKANYLCRLSIFNSPGTWVTTMQLWGMTECCIFICSHNCMATSPNNGMAAKAWNMQLHMGAVGTQYQKVDSGWKIACCTRKLNLYQQRSQPSAQSSELHPCLGI